MSSLQGKNAVVTGAASGIGEASAKAFAREGARVVVADVNAERGTSVSDAIAAAAASRYSSNAT